MAHFEAAAAAAACTVAAAVAVVGHHHMGSVPLFHRVVVVGHHHMGSAPLFHKIAVVVVAAAENHSTNCLEVVAVVVGHNSDWVAVAALHNEKVGAAAVHTVIEEAAEAVVSAVLVAEPGTASEEVVVDRSIAVEVEEEGVAEVFHLPLQEEADHYYCCFDNAMSGDIDVGCCYCSCYCFHNTMDHHHHFGGYRNWQDGDCCFRAANLVGRSYHGCRRYCFGHEIALGDTSHWGPASCWFVHALTGCAPVVVSRPSYNDSECP